MPKILTSKYVSLTTCILLFLPHVASKPFPGKPPRIDLPRVISGDEPHYLLMINSVLYDGDLDLRNNYLSSHHGSQQAGLKFAGKPLNHQTGWMVDGRQRVWTEYYHRWEWTRDSGGFLAPFPLNDRASRVVSLPEYGEHPPGLAFLLAPFLFPFKRAPLLIEPVALLLTGMATMLAFFFIRLLLRRFTVEKSTADFWAAIIVLGSPLWHYGRALYTEAFLTLFAAAAYVLFIRYGRHFVPGLMIGLGILMKPFFILLALPLTVALIYRKRFKGLTALLAPIACASCVFLGLNKAMFEGYFSFCQPFLRGNIITGAVNFWLSTQRGLLFTCPIAAIALIAWPVFIKKFGADALILASGFILYFTFMAFFLIWHGGDSYGPRLILPVLPFLLIPLCMIPRMKLWEHRLIRHLIILVIMVSIGINACAAICSWQFLNRSPLVALFMKAGFL